jgi:hypothetical protein
MNAAPAARHAAFTGHRRVVARLRAHHRAVRRDERGRDRLGDHGHRDRGVELLKPRRARLGAVLPDVRLAQVKLRAEVGERHRLGVLQGHRLDARQDHVLGCARERRDRSR